jgi:uncharacterized protein YuzE
MVKELKIWYDLEADYLEILFEAKAGYFRETDHDAVMEKIDSLGQVIGFSILGVSQQMSFSPVVTSILNLVRLSETSSHIPMDRLLAEFEPFTVSQKQEVCSLL